MERAFEIFYEMQNEGRVAADEVRLPITTERIHAGFIVRRLAKPPIASNEHCV